MRNLVVTRDYSTLSDNGWLNKGASVRVPEETKLSIYQDGHKEGLSKTFIGLPDDGVEELELECQPMGAELANSMQHLIYEVDNGPAVE